MELSTLRTVIYQTILDLATEEGINASGKEEIYGCLFGRDSFITILKLLKVIANPAAKQTIDTAPLQQMCKRALETMIELQGRETNLESGEEPGKFIHEYRKDKYDHLVKRPVRPWFLYPDKLMRNYDSIDSTPLGLIAIYKYWQVTGDDAFLLKALPAVENGLNWIITYGDRDKDFLLEYELPADRKHGGLVVQSWTDSQESLLQADGTFPVYPIAPVEVQGYAWLALQLWADFYESTTHYSRTKNYGNKLRSHAEQLKKRFNDAFFFTSENYLYPAQALNGVKQQIKTVTGNPLLLLWATYTKDGKKESIIDDRRITDLIRRSFLPDLFDPEAGIRTMSSLSRTFDPSRNSYHNGSYWPKLNGMAHEGLAQWGFASESEALLQATLKPIAFFGSPIELYIKTSEGEYLLYQNESGQQSCRQQAWSAAAALDLLTL
jgi:glycogen debranching enzyme